MSGLLQPTLQDHVARADHERRPWRVGSQIYVGILGGPVAVTVIAVINATRLRLPAARRNAIVAVGLATTVLAVAVTVALPEEARMLAQLTGAAAAGVFWLLMRTYDRAYFAFSPLGDEEAYDELWVPGIGAVIGGWVLLAIAAGVLAS